MERLALGTSNVLRELELLLVRLEVPVNDAQTVYVLQSQHCLRGIHLSHFRQQAAHILQQGGQVPTFNILHHHVQVVLKGGGLQLVVKLFVQYA